MRVIDWLIVALVASAVVAPILLLSVDAERRPTVHGATVLLAAVGCILLLIWIVFADGAHSSLWRWLPPFWPWSRYITTTVSRQLLVVLLVLGTVLGILFSM
jgi:hypothetical protein